MKTSELIGMLAAGAGPAVRVHPARRLAPAIGGGVLLAAALSIGLLGLVPREMFAGPALWTKLAYTGLLAGGAAWLAALLARPLVPGLRRPVLVLALVVSCMALLGLATWLAAAPADKLAVLLGRTWYRCPAVIFAVSLPALAVLLGTLRSLAPTRPRSAGWAAGLLAGALGAIGYSLHCPEVSALFVAVWYSLGIAATGALGALLGPRVLRW